MKSIEKEIMRVSFLPSDKGANRDCLLLHLLYNDDIHRQQFGNEGKTVASYDIVHVCALPFPVGCLFTLSGLLYLLLLTEWEMQFTDTALGIISKG